MPGGYSLASVRVGSKDLSEGLVVGNADVSGVVITVAAPRGLPRVRGRISGLAGGRPSPAKVEMTGPIIGKLEAPVQKDGSFVFAAVTPGRYDLKLPQVPELAPISVVVGWDDVDVPVSVPVR
jgi:hypothetical protein